MGWDPFRKTHLESFGVTTSKASDAWTVPVRKDLVLHFTFEIKLHHTFLSTRQDLVLK